MWRWLLLTILCLVTPLSLAAPTSSGPTSIQEAQLLWQEGESASKEFRYQDAINALQRYIDRYPGQPSYLKAHLLLGEAFLKLEKYEKAIHPLKSYISSSHATEDNARARLGLIQTYLELKKFHEAYLTTLEINQLESKVHLPSDLLLESYLLKSQALLGLNRTDEAIEVLSATDKKISTETKSYVKAHAYQLQLRLKSLHCARFPTKDPLDESQIRDQLDRRGTCLLESLLSFHKVLQSGDLRYAALTAAHVTEAFNTYSQKCHSPPLPVFKEKRTAKQLKSTTTELVDRLDQDCKSKLLTALDLLNSWKKGLSSNMIGPLIQVSKNLEDHTSRTR
jgi:tetratricopeptide (TPR) repeat protein